MNRRIFLVGVLGAVSAAWLGRVGPARGAQEPRTVKIVLIGDSTVNDQLGWGPGFKAHLKGDAACANWAQNGRSSRSFVDEGWWKKALAERPDYVLIQFGHNDQPGKGAKRETDPQTSYKEFLTKYIDETKAAGGKPILVTSLSRRKFDNGKVREDLKAYVEAVRELGKEKGVPVIDLNKRSVDLLNQMGEKKAEAFDPPAKDATVEGATTQAATAQAAAKVPDKTHLSKTGQRVFGAIVAEELKRVAPELKGNIN
jgi:lysophospholipase L1-like esterase